jgi:hypothetical protein
MQNQYSDRQLLTLYIQRQNCRSFFDIYIRSRRGRDRIVVGYSTTDAISSYHQDNSPTCDYCDFTATIPDNDYRQLQKLGNYQKYFNVTVFIRQTNK